MNSLPKNQEALITQLRALTRYGLFGTAKARKRGVTVSGSDGRAVVLRPEDIDQIIDEIDVDSEVNYDALVQRLVAGPSSLNLSTTQTLKLRAQLLLALAAARNWQTDTNTRKAALARTYPRKATGRYLETFDDTMREDLLRQIAAAIARSLITVVPAAGVNGDAITESSEGAEPARAGIPPTDPYVTTHYEGHRVEPNGTSPFRNSHRRTIKALRAGVSEFRQTMSFSWTGAAMPDHHIVGPGNLRIENLRSLNWSNVRGYQYDLVVAFRPLAEGQTRQIAWDVTTAIDGDYFENDSKLKIFGVNPRGVFEYAHVSVRFSPDRLPAKVWRLDGIPRDSWELESVGDPNAHLEDFVLDGEWRDLAPGRVYGARWRWGGAGEVQPPNADLT